MCCALRSANLVLPLLIWAPLLAQGPREQQLALPLLLLLGQQLRVIALQTESPHLKLVAELYDKASQTLLQVYAGWQANATNICCASR